MIKRTHDMVETGYSCSALHVSRVQYRNYHRLLIYVKESCFLGCISECQVRCTNPGAPTASRFT